MIQISGPELIPFGIKSAFIFFCKLYSAGTNNREDVVSQLRAVAQLLLLPFSILLLLPTLPEVTGKKKQTDSLNKNPLVQSTLKQNGER